VITCNRCGYKATDGATSCAKCGAPLLNPMESSFQPHMGGQEQSEIPAWLESLRVGERPASPANAPAQFSAADLIEEGTLPTWMRSGRTETPGVPASDPFQSPAASQMNAEGPAQGLNAQSLIDEKSLPTWMKEKDASPSSRPQNGFEASSLIEQDVLPDWMKSLQPQASASSDRTVSPAQPNSAPRDEAPSWMKSMQPQTPVQQGPTDIPVTPSNPFTPPEKGFSAADLLDEQSLPSWMSQQGEGAPTRDDRPRQPNSLSPSSLIDQDALPAWMKELDRSQQSMSQQPQSQPMQAPSFGNAGPVSPPDASFSGQGLTGSSLIDSNSLPDWLRSSPGQAGSVPPMPQQANMPNPPNMPNIPMSYNTGTPPHVDNVRVPSRPRSDISADQNNEAAANAFASVLGVASNAPQLPGSMPPQPPYGQYMASPRPQQGMPPSMPPSSSSNMPSQPPAQGYPGMPPQGPASLYGGAQSGSPSGSYNNPVGSYVPASNMPPGAPMGTPASGNVPPQYQYPPSSTGGAMPTSGGASAFPGEQQSGKKRSLVDRLLGWLSR
jgi:hypothetical protein